MFRCLLKHRVLHYHPEKATKIINACTVLHNICIINNIPLPNDKDQVDLDMGVFQQNIPNNEVYRQGNDLILIQGRHFRSTIVNYMQRNRQH